MQLLAEEKERGAKSQRALGAGIGPFAAELLGGFVLDSLLDLEKPDAVILPRNRFSDTRRPVGPAHGIVHVRLARAEPDIAHQHILDGEGIRSAHDELRRLGRDGLRRQQHHPAAVRAGDRGLGVRAKAHGHLFARGRSAPYGQRALALEHHVIAKQIVQNDIRPGGIDAQHRGD